MKDIMIKREETSNKFLKWKDYEFGSQTNDHSGWNSINNNSL